MTNWLIALWDANDRAAVSSELDKLFALQDRPLAKEKKAVLMTELEATGVPARTLIAGFHKLMVEDVRSLKFSVLIEAARETITTEPERPATRCDDCLSGTKLMYDEKNHEFALACRCLSGESRQRSGLARWDGEPLMNLRGRLLSVARKEPT